MLYIVLLIRTKGPAFRENTVKHTRYYDVNL